MSRAYSWKSKVLQTFSHLCRIPSIGKEFKRKISVRSYATEKDLRVQLM